MKGNDCTEIRIIHQATKLLSIKVIFLQKVIDNVKNSFKATSKLFCVQVNINIPSLPAIGLSDRLLCSIKSFESEGTMSDSGQVSCDLPNPSLIPPTPADQGMAFINVCYLLERGLSHQWAERANSLRVPRP